MRSLIPFFAIGATALPSGKDNGAANGDKCSRASLDALIKEHLPHGARLEDYLIRHRVSNKDNKIDFGTAMCKAAPWQGKENPYAHVHDAEKVEEFKDWVEDNEARDAWILKNGGSDIFPAGSGGFFWCNEKNGQWIQSKDLPNCPHADVKGAWKATGDGYNGQDFIINGEPVKTWNTDCVTYFKTGLKKEKAEAKQYCEDQGLQLAQQRNEEEWKLLQGEGSFWMDAVRSDADVHQWVWGEPDSTTDVDCLFWNPGEPNNPHSEKCLHGNWGDAWNDRSCGGNDAVICEKRTCVPSCDHLRINGREVESIESECVTYFKTDKQMKRADAKQFCEDHGLKLATQKNNKEHEIMKDNGKSFWLDGARSNSDVHQWVWGEPHSPVDINKLGCFFWKSGQPDHYGDNENCMHVLTSGLWNDINCDAKYYVTCELRTCDGICENMPPHQVGNTCLHAITDTLVTETLSADAQSEWTLIGDLGTTQTVIYDNSQSEDPAYYVCADFYDNEKVKEIKVKGLSDDIWAVHSAYVTYKGNDWKQFFVTKDKKGAFINRFGVSLKTPSKSTDNYSANCFNGQSCTLLPADNLISDKLIGDAAKISVQDDDTVCLHIKADTTVGGYGSGSGIKWLLYDSNNQEHEIIYERNNYSYQNLEYKKCIALVNAGHIRRMSCKAIGDDGFSINKVTLTYSDGFRQYWAGKNNDDQYVERISIDGHNCRNCEPHYLMDATDGETHNLFPKEFLSSDKINLMQKCIQENECSDV